ncbi:hypothetical protein H6G89_09420 [Oscillatoria sp. FACHB-1407]|uniref:hypothetical protein n=1 Tax=Oscillatoria sp. FACHB-1407 TaxID=2692847 RepID=UPI001686115B|nr:hypothetical protein [Oscillatoria sp. FACHB-1407]MBD2461264.1 hypothetical protein [Oscillatoria sp. FACHB-1407]
MKRYSEISLETGSTHSSEWTPGIQESALEPTMATCPSSSATGKGLTVISTTVMVMLLLLSVSAVLWGTVKLSQSVAQLTQFAVQEAMQSNP